MIEYKHELTYPQFEALIQGFLGTGLFIYSLYSDEYYMMPIAGALCFYVAIKYFDYKGLSICVRSLNGKIEVAPKRKITAFRSKRFAISKLEEAVIKVGHEEHHGSDFYHYDIILKCTSGKTSTFVRINEEKIAIEIRDYINKEIREKHNKSLKSDAKDAHFSEELCERS